MSQYFIKFNVILNKLAFGYEDIIIQMYKEISVIRAEFIHVNYYLCSVELLKDNNLFLYNIILAFINLVFLLLFRLFMHLNRRIICSLYSNYYMYKINKCNRYCDAIYKYFLKYPLILIAIIHCLIICDYLLAHYLLAIVYLLYIISFQCLNLILV